MTTQPKPISDLRPANCRFRLQEEGRPYPRSSCVVCGRTVTSGLGNHCFKLDVTPVAPKPISDEDLAVVKDLTTDWDGSKLVGLEHTRLPVLVGTLEALIARIEQQQASLASKDAEIERLREAASELLDDFVLFAGSDDYTSFPKEWPSAEKARAALKQE